MPVSEGTVRVSSKYQVVIPPEIREGAAIRPGDRFRVLVAPDGLRLVRIVPLAALRGRVKRDDDVPVREELDRS